MASAIIGHYRTFPSLSYVAYRSIALNFVVTTSKGYWIGGTCQLKNATVGGSILTNVHLPCSNKALIFSRNNDICLVFNSLDQLQVILKRKLCVCLLECFICRRIIYQAIMLEKLWMDLHAIRSIIIFHTEKGNIS